MINFFSIDDDTGLTIEDSCCLGWFIFISLLRRFTFCPSILSSTFGARFRRTLSVVECFFDVLLFDVDVVEPNKRKGDVGIGLKSGISISDGFARSCWESCWNKKCWVFKNERICYIHVVNRYWMVMHDYRYQQIHYVEQEIIWMLKEEHLDLFL